MLLPNCQEWSSMSRGIGEPYRKGSSFWMSGLKQKPSSALQETVKRSDPSDAWREIDKSFLAPYVAMIKMICPKHTLASKTWMRLGDHFSDTLPPYYLHIYFSLHNFICLLWMSVWFLSMSVCFSASRYAYFNLASVCTYAFLVGLVFMSSLYPCICLH